MIPHSSQEVFPPNLLPLVAPLSRSVIDYLSQQEQRLSRGKEYVAHDTFYATIITRIADVRSQVYEYMDVFVQADQKHGNHWLDDRWLLEILRAYAPAQKPYNWRSIYVWLSKGFLKRVSPRGPFTLISVAALLIARLFREEYHRSWLPQALLPDEPLWWCYALEAREASRQIMPIPLPPDISPATLLWTPWLGARWEGWHQRGSLAYRWAGVFTTIDEVAQWNSVLAEEIAQVKQHQLFGRSLIQHSLIVEASRVILEEQVQQLHS